MLPRIVFVSLLIHSIDAWTLKETYAGPTFFDKFTYFTDPDPTNGYVDYVSKDEANSLNLTYTGNDGRVYMAAESRNIASGRGRKSVRLESVSEYNSGSLLIFDINHMPYGCGTWPSIWMLGPNWPSNGEIDIIEGVNN
jgi:beta-glucanase (GH16 family)